MYQRKVDVDMLNAVKNVLAYLPLLGWPTKQDWEELSVSPQAVQA